MASFQFTAEGKTHQHPAGAAVARLKSEANGTPARAGSWAEFERRFAPIEAPDGCPMWQSVAQISDVAHLWTITEGDNGELYACEGWHLVNRLGYVICRNPRADLPPHGGAYKIFKY